MRSESAPHYEKQTTTAIRIGGEVVGIEDDGKISTQTKPPTVCGIMVWNRTGDRSRHRSFSFVVGSWRRYPHYIFFLSPFDAPYRPILDSLVYSCNVVVVGLWSPSIPRPSPILHGHLLSTNAIRRKDPILFPLLFCSSPSPSPPAAAAAAAAAADPAAAAAAAPR